MKRIARRIFWGFFGGLLAVILLSALVGWRVARTDWFREKVRTRIIAEIENATGGRAEAGAFKFNPSTLEAEVRRFVLHGTEGPAEAPLFQAESVTVGLRIVSVFQKKIDLALLTVQSAEVNIVAGPDGQLNFPRPKVARQSGRTVVEEFVRLAVGHFRFLDGRVTYRSEVIPLDVDAHGLDVRFTYDHLHPAYEGVMEADRVRVARPLRSPIDVRTAGRVRVEGDRLTIRQATIATDSTRLEVAAEVASLRQPVLDAQVRGNVSVSDAITAIRLPVERTGTVAVDARVRLGGPERWIVTGRATGRGVAYRSGAITVTDITGSGPFTASPPGLVFPQLTASALGAEFRGEARLDQWKNYAVKGELTGLAVSRAAAAIGRQDLAWAGVMSGPVEVSGPLPATVDTVAVTTSMRIEPRTGGPPVSGQFSVRVAGGRIDLGLSEVQLPSSRIFLRGSADEVLEVGVTSTNLDDLQALLAFTGRGEQELPARLERGEVKLDAKISGGWPGGTVSGHLTAGGLMWRGERLDRVDSDFRATSGRLELTAIDARQAGLSARGNLSLELDGWKLTDRGRIEGRMEVAGVSLSRFDPAVQGEGRLTADLRGVVSDPRALGTFRFQGLSFAGQRFDSAAGEFRANQRLVEAVGVQLAAGPDTIQGDASVDLAQNPRVITVRASSNDFALTRVAALDRVRAGLAGEATFTASAVAALAGERLTLRQLDGTAAVTGITVDGRPAGDLTLRAQTTQGTVHLESTVQLRGSSIRGTAEWAAGSNSFGLVTVDVARLDFSSLHDLGLLGDAARPLPFNGNLIGQVSVAGPILDPEKWTAQARVTSLNLRPLLPGARLRNTRYELRNQGPLSAYIDADGINVQSARMVADGTDLELQGAVSFTARNPWNLRLKGALSLPVLNNFEPDLLASGSSTIDATIRGSLERPQLLGRMTLNDAAFSLRGLPNGLEKTNGVISFDRNRANIEKLTAQSGGGDLAITGFIGFGTGQFQYRLQATARNVRVRYPDAVSTTFTANLNLTGTSTRSLLAGDITVNRMALNPRTDIGGLLAEARTSGAPAPSSSGFLRGMQLDVQARTAADAELQTSLARDLQPIADLRLRGTAANPVVLGRVSVNEGRIQFFGNEYNIARGDISFFNQAKIEPVVDFDFETRVRGVTVNINFSGPIEKLNVSYRSDPPLQSSEIVALLAVGRAPGSGVTSPNLSSSGSNQGFLYSSNNSLLGQAISAPISGSLQRLFGISRIKIDPELTGVTNTPQARLTVEQQLSRDITVTYITNLNRSQQQIVRLQWDFSRDYSLLAVRDENGVFGVDFLFRKRFK